MPNRDGTGPFGDYVNCSNNGDQYMGQSRSQGKRNGCNNQRKRLRFRLYRNQGQLQQENSSIIDELRERIKELEEEKKGLVEKLSNNKD